MAGQAGQGLRNYLSTLANCLALLSPRIVIAGGLPNDTIWLGCTAGRSKVRAPPSCSPFTPSFDADKDQKQKRSVSLHSVPSYGDGDGDGDCCRSISFVALYCIAPTHVPIKVHGTPIP